MMEVIQTDLDPFILGIVSDTHVPDRVMGLHPALLDELRDHKVDMILHAGDVSVRSVISQLEEVAPVRAVLGNRDILLRNDIPIAQTMNIHQTVLSLTHGHLDLGTYWGDKFSYVTMGYRFERYQKRLARAFPEADVIVFGHTHHAENRWVDEKLYFNPGSVSRGDYLDSAISFGVLAIYRDGIIHSEIFHFATKP